MHFCILRRVDVHFDLPRAVDYSKRKLIVVIGMHLVPGSRVDSDPEVESVNILACVCISIAHIEVIVGVIIVESELCIIPGTPALAPSDGLLSEVAGAFIAVRAELLKDEGGWSSIDVVCLGQVSCTEVLRILERTLAKVELVGAIGSMSSLYSALATGPSIYLYCVNTSP